MAQPKHRPFNADRFIDKFNYNAELLWDYLDQWKGDIPNVPSLHIPEAFMSFLKKPPENCRAFEEMVEGLYMAYDLSTKQGHELMFEAMEMKNSPLKGEHKIPREVLALRLLVEDKDTFELATNLLMASQVDKFSTFKGKSPQQVPSVNSAVVKFKEKLQKLFEKSKGSEKVLVKHFEEEKMGSNANYKDFYQILNNLENREALGSGGKNGVKRKL